MSDSSVVIANMALMRASVNKEITSLDDASASARACKAFYEPCRDRVLEAFPWPFATRRRELSPLTGADYAAGTTYALGDLAYYGATLYRSLVAANTGNTPPSSTAHWVQVTRDGWAFVCPLPDDFIDNGAQWIYSKPTASASSTFNTSGIPPASLRAPRPEERTPFKMEDANDGTATGVLLTDLQSPILVYTAKISDTKRYSATFTSCLAWLLAHEVATPLRSDAKLAKELYAAYLLALSEATSAQGRGQQQDPEPISEFEAARQ